MTSRAFCAAVHGMLVEQHGYEETRAMFEPAVPVSLDDRRATAAALGGEVRTYG